MAMSAIFWIFINLEIHVKFKEKVDSIPGSYQSIISNWNIPIIKFMDKANKLILDAKIDTF